MAKLTRKDKIRLQAMAAQNATTASLSNEDMMLLLKAKDLENERLKAELAQEKKKNALKDDFLNSSLHKIYQEFFVLIDLHLHLHFR